MPPGPRTADRHYEPSIRPGRTPLPAPSIWRSGALQFRALSREVKMTLRRFHDAALKLGSIPVEMIRATLLNLPLPAGYRSTWRFCPNP